MFNTYNPYITPYTPYTTYSPYYMQNQRSQSVDQNYSQVNQQNNLQNPMHNRQSILQGKTVDSIDVVKAMDIPLDGTISYFPLTDGTAIVTKQLQLDGTSKTIIFKPAEDLSKENNYITEEQANKLINNYSNKDIKEIKDIKDDIKAIKRQIRDINDDLKDKKED